MCSMRELPKPLPPQERTVGQLVGETIRAYGDNFWRALPLGLPLALVDQLAVHRSIGAQVLLYYAAAPLIAGAYVWAGSVVARVPFSRGAFWLALLVYLPFPLLRAVFILPAVAWFALVGLAVPAFMLEPQPAAGLRARTRAALRRGFELGRVDYVHALGSLAALVVVVGVGEETLWVLLHSMSDANARVALALADVVLSPLLYLGGAMLYGDQAARAGGPALVLPVAAVPPRRSRSARRA
jgi:hypothetical protein